ncbi:hypothetical protein MNBD_GAMMA22-871 [hydrothermal vent metagenome]|uniref:Serine aminopeptidase S33 domain-containing protein n=1 Tax=hydrothermal vent metagenome TaxID=652676 RepID=A0A3B0ZRH9_9ZZZZ
MMIRPILMLLPALFLTISNSYASTGSPEKNSITRANSDLTINFQLQKTAAKSGSILLFVQDSKCKSSSEQFFKLTESLSNIAKLYVDKIGESDAVKAHATHAKCSDNFISNSSIDQRLADYQQVIKHLRNTATWWDKKLYLIGESEGGLIAGLIAANTSETTKLAIISFGGGMTMSESWIKSLTKSMLAKGSSVADIDALKVRATEFFKNKIAESTSNKEIASNVTYKWWASVVDVRLSDSLSKADFPIYIAHGTDDIKIPVESAQKISDLFTTLGKENLTYNEYTGTIAKVSTSNATTTATNNLAFTEALNWLVN